MAQTVVGSFAIKIAPPEGNFTFINIESIASGWISLFDGDWDRHANPTKYLQ